MRGVNLELVSDRWLLRACLGFAAFKAYRIVYTKFPCTARLSHVELLTEADHAEGNTRGKQWSCPGRASDDMCRLLHMCGVKYPDKHDWGTVQPAGP